MQYIRLLVPDDRSDEVRALLRERDATFVVLETEAEDGGEYLFQFPFPDEGVQELFEALTADAGLDDDQFRVVSGTETVTGANEERLQEAYADEGLPPEELVSNARELDLDWYMYATMTLLSTVVAAAGLLRSSAAAIVGAMVIAPFFGSSLAATTGLCCGDREVLVDGVRSQVGGLCLAVGGAVAVGAAARTFAFVPPGWDLSQSAQFGLFSGPSVLSTLVAVAAGAAGGIALATAVPTALASVAIAAAITPSAAAVGLSVAWGDPRYVVGSLVLLGVNVFAVNLAAAGLFTSLGYIPRPLSLAPDGPSLARARYFAVAGVTVLLIVGIAATAAQFVAFSLATNEAVAAEMDGSYEDLALADVSVEHGVGPPVSLSGRVTVTAFRAGSRPHPNLDDDLRRAIRRRTGRRVEVEVRYVPVEAVRANDHRRWWSRTPGGATPLAGAHADGGSDARATAR